MGKDGKQSYFSTLCWKCGNACTKGCSWAEKLEPVDGWDAAYSPVKTGWGETIDSYIVFGCPEYKQDARIRAKDMSMDGVINLMEACIDLARKDYILGKAEERHKIRDFFVDIAPNSSRTILKKLAKQAEEHDDEIATKRFRAAYAADLAVMHKHWIHMFVVDAYRDFALAELV